MFPDMSDGDVFFSIQLMWGVIPPVLLVLCVATWQSISKCKTVSDVHIKIKITCVALLYLVWPSLCSQTFSLFSCRRICDDTITFLRADLEVPCGEGIHFYYAFGLGLPMLFLYVIGLPMAALLRVRRMHQTKHIDPDDKKIYGIFYTAYREDVWWWEGTVAARKIAIALIGVFGAEMGDMQVHLTSMLVVWIIIVTAQVRPFGGRKHGVLHVLEMTSLMASFLTLWAGSIFNTRPKCEDPLKGEGSRLLWCDALSIIVGFFDICVLVAIVVCFVCIKIKWASDTKTSILEKRSDGGEMTFYENPCENNVVKKELIKRDGKEKRRKRLRNIRKKLSSVDLGRCMSPNLHNSKTRNNGKLDDASGMSEKKIDLAADENLTGTVEKVDHTEVSIELTTLTTKTMRTVAFDYVAASSGELCLEVGDEIEILEAINDGVHWGIGKNLRTGETGEFPVSYLSHVNCDDLDAVIAGLNSST